MTVLQLRDEVPALLRMIDIAHENTLSLDTETTGLDMFGLKDRRKGTKGDIIEEERSIGPARVCGLVLGVPLGDKELRTFYLPFRHETDEPQLPVEDMRRIMQHIEDRRMTLVGHNIKFDLKQLHGDGCLPDDRKVKIEDTMLLEHVLQTDSEEDVRFNLGNLASKRIGHDPSYKVWVKDEVRLRKYRRFSQFRVEELAPYAEDDVFMTWAVRQQQKPKLLDPSAPWYGGPDQLEVYETDNRLLWALLRMELRGMKVDRPRSEMIIRHLSEIETTAREKLIDAAGRDVNIMSHKQLTDLFHEKQWPIPISKLTFSPSFADVWLQGVESDDAAFKAFRENMNLLRAVHTNRDMYIDAYLRLADPYDVVHPSFQANGTVTGRLSCKEPNFQNIRKRYGSISTRRETYSGLDDALFEVRSVFVPQDDEHRFLGFDYSQQETRMFLNYSKEPTMTKVVMEGGDIHVYAAEAMYREPMPPKYLPDGRENQEYLKRRGRAKTMNFGILYSMGPRKLAEAMEVDEEWARQVWHNYMDTFPGIRAFMDRVTAVAESRLWIRTAFNRRLRFRLLTEEEKARGRAKSNLGWVKVREGQRAFTHKALNYLIQGSCADLTRRAMIRVDELLRGTQSYMVNQVHDELLFELHEKERKELRPEIEKALTTWPQFDIPFTVEPKEPEWAWSDPKKKEAAA